MSRHGVSYKAPSVLVIDTSTDERQDDTDRGSLWTREEIEWLRDNYGNMSSSEAAEILRRSPISVRIKMHRVRMGIKMGHVSVKHSGPRNGGQPNNV